MILMTRSVKLLQIVIVHVGHDNFHAQAYNYKIQ
jgi:hypothetical protein